MFVQGSFPGRKRVVMRPRYHISPASTATATADGSTDGAVEGLEGEEEVKRAVAQALAGHIQDVRR